MAIAFSSILTVLIIVMALLGCASLRVKKFRLFLALAMTFPFFISVIAVGLSRNMILVSQSWPREIKFESYLRAKATFCKSILLPFANELDMVPIFSI